MKEISHLLRASYLSLLNPLTVEGVVIPIFDERVNPNVPIPTYRTGKAYVLITDQNEVETTNNRCNLRKTATINFQIITKYPLNLGGKLASELISNAIQEKVRIILLSTIFIDGFQILSTRVPLNQGLPPENGGTETAYRKLLAFSHSIYEL